MTIKVGLTVLAELLDLAKSPGSVSMREHLCKMIADDGVQYSVSRVVGSLTLVVSKAVDGAGGLHEAHIDFEPLVEKAAAALKEHREAIEGEVVGRENTLS